MNLSASVAGSTSTPDMDRVNAAFAAWDATFDTGDATALATFYLPDAYVLPPTHQVVTGAQAIETFFAGQFAAHVTGHTLVPFDIADVNGTFVVSSHWAAHGQDNTGKPIQFGGLATHVLVPQSDGSLKLRLHIFN